MKCIKYWHYDPRVKPESFVALCTNILSASSKWWILTDSIVTWIALPLYSSDKQNNATYVFFILWPLKTSHGLLTTESKWQIPVYPLMRISSKKLISVILVITWIKLQYTQRFMHMLFHCVFHHLVSFDYTHILQGYFNGNETLTPVTEKQP